MERQSGFLMVIVSTIAQINQAGPCPQSSQASSKSQGMHNYGISKPDTFQHLSILQKTQKC